MITRHHITLAILCTLILTVAVIPGNYWMMGLIMLGAVIGSVLPDIHMKKPSRLRLLTAAYYLTRFCERVCMPVMKFFIRNLLNTPIADKDKRATHSMAGLFFIFVTMAGFVFIPVWISGNLIILIAAETFLSGIAGGLVLHIIADMCTKKGITPFFPFSTLQVSGSIRPCNPDDRRIAGYHSILCLVLAVVITMPGYGKSPVMIEELFAPLGLLLCFGTMLYFSRTRVKKDWSTSGTPANVSEHSIEQSRT